MTTTTKILLAALPMLVIALLATMITTASTPAPAPASIPLPAIGCDSLDVAVDGDTIHLLIGTNTAPAQGDKSCDFHHTRSADGGKTWSPLVLVSGNSRQAVPHHRGSDASIVAKGNKLFAAWTTPGTGFHGTGPMGTALSTDGGKTWQAGPDPSDQQTTGSSRFLALTADANAFHLIWLDDREKQRGLRHASSTNGGKTWSVNNTIDDLTCACCWNEIIHVPASAKSSDKQGELFALYRDMNPSDMGLARSTDGGKTWNKLGHIGEYGWLFKGCPHVGGGLSLSESPDGTRQLFSVIWTGMPGKIGCHLFASDNDGRGWIPVRPIGEDTAKHPTLAASGQQICVVWDDIAGDDRAAFCITSSDAGKSWSKPMRLSAAATQGTHARVIANPDGQGFVVFWTQSTSSESPALKSRAISTTRAE